MRFVYFDDEPNPRERLARALTNDALEVRAQAPPPNLDLSTLPDVDGFIVDYELTRPQPDGARSAYKGGTLASALRDAQRALPIVLLTRRNLVDGKTETDLLDELSLFDAVLFKGNVARARAATRVQLIGLGEGFKHLREAEKSWDGLVDVLHPPSSSDLEALREVPPPNAGERWETVPVARWLERVLLRYPGVLLDGDHLAATLGVLTEATQDQELLELFAPARYLGPLSDSTPRWWKRSVVSIASGFISLGSASLHHAFQPAFLATFGVDLPVAWCLDECGQPAGARCFVLQRPVRHEHSVLYFPDQRPGAMDPARISFSAIRETNDVLLERIEAAAEPLVLQLREQA